MMTLSEARELLASQQPTISRKFATDGPYIEFDLAPDIFVEWKSKSATDIIHATIQVGNQAFELTKEAFLRALALIGIREAYAVKTPHFMIQEAMNYHMSHSGAANETLRLQARGDVVSTFLPGDSLAVSSVKFLDMVVKEIPTTHIEVDSKISNTMNRMAIRLILPTSTGIGSDPWAPGYQLVNSATGSPASRTSITGIMYNRTNGTIALSSHARSGVYDRRSYSTEDEEFSDWIAAHVPNIRHGLDMEFAAIGTLRNLDLTGQLGDTMTDLFRTLKVPARVRPDIYNYVINQDEKTGYMLMQAIAQSANKPGLDDEMAARTMTVAGALPHLLSDRCETCHKVNV